MKNFVDSAWVWQNIDSNKFVIVDCRGDLLNNDYGKTEYDAGHIKGAVFIDVKEDLSSEQAEHGGRNPLPTMEKFKEKLESLGIGNETTVIAYDEQKIACAARLCWMLRYIGHNNNLILNGGINKWINLGYPVTKKLPQIKRNRLDVAINNNIYADVKYVSDSINKKGTNLIDSRTEIRYKGEMEPIDPVAGHIPGAKNYYWKNSLKEDGTVKETDKLEELFEMIKGYSEILVYCGSGIDAAFNYMILDEFGIRSKLYLGSFSDWITYSENKIIVE